MIRVDENVNPNIMLSPNVLNKHENVTDTAKTVKLDTVFAKQVVKKRRCENSKNDNKPLPLAERKAVVLHTPPAAATSFYENDIAMLKTALGGTERTHVEKFEKEHQLSLQTIIHAGLQEIAAFRQLNPTTSCGGLKKAEIKKWKLLVNFDGNLRVRQVVVGFFKASGSFTKVYFTLDGRVILVPRKLKGDPNEQMNPNMQMNNAYAIVNFLHKSLSPFQRQQLMPLLPPIPDKFMVDRRPIMVAPKATSVNMLFFSAPNCIQDVIERLQIIKDAADGLKFCHEKRVIHGDIKPDNLLVKKNGRGQLHDFGGSCVFTGKETPTDAVLKYNNISFTAFYSHYQDYLARKRLISEGACVGSFIQLGRARDVFALGVSTLDALMGVYDSNKKKHYPFRIDSYYTHRTLKANFPNGDFDSCKELSCLEKMPPEICERVKALLKSSLEKGFAIRITASEFAIQLDKIIVDLKAATSPTGD